MKQTGHVVLRLIAFRTLTVATSAVLASVLLCLVGCKGNQRQDTVIAAVSNPGHTYRAFVILRQYYVDGKFDTTPSTYVLVKKESDAEDYKNGEEFKDEEIVMQPVRCGPLSVKWTGDFALTVICEKCGLALTAVGPHVRGLGPVKVEYAGFPEMSSWEAAPRSN